MSLISSIVQRATGAAGRRPRGGGVGGASAARGGSRRQDEAIGRGIRSLLGRARRR